MLMQNNGREINFLLTTASPLYTMNLVDIEEDLYFYAY